MKRTSTKFLSIATSLAFATTLVVGASSPVLAKAVSNGQFKTGLPACGHPYKCINFSGLEGLGGSQWVGHLDPSDVTDVTSEEFVNPMDGALVNLLPFRSKHQSVGNGYGWVFPDMAKSISLSKNKLTWTFHLRHGLKFADGDPMTAWDFKWSLARSDMPSLASPVTAYYDGYIKGVNDLSKMKNSTSIYTALNVISRGVTVSGKYTLYLTTTQKTPFFLEALTYPTADILDPGCPNGCNSASDLKNAKNGMALAGQKEYSDPTWLTNDCQGAQEDSAGALMPVCLSGGVDATHANFFSGTPDLTLQPNPHYYGKKAHYLLRNKVVDTTEDGIADYNAGGSTALDDTSIPTVQIKTIQNACSKTKNNGIPAACPKKSGSAFVENPTSNVQYYTPNESLHYNGKSGAGSPFHFLPCRLVLAYGVNTGALVKVLHYSVQQQHSILPSNIGGYLGKHPSGVPSYNPKKAEDYVKPCLKDLSSAEHKMVSTLSWDVTYPGGSQDAANEQLKTQFFLNKLKHVHESATEIPVNNWYTAAAQDLNNSDYSILSNGWQEDFPDGFDYETLLLGQNQNYNIGNWEARNLSTKAEKDAVNKYNSLINKAAVSFNQNKRAQWYQQAAKIALSQGVWVTRFNALGFALIHKNIHGFVGSPQYGELIPNNDNWSSISVS